MKRVLQILLILAGAFVVLEGVYIMAIMNFMIGIAFQFTFGGVLLIYGIFFTQLNRIFGKGFLKWMRYAAYILFAFVIGFCGFLYVYGTIDTCDHTEDAVIVLGAAIRGEMVTTPLAWRLDAAYEYFQNNSNAVIVVSGGQGPQEAIPEGLAMQRYLVAKGIPQDKIIIEDKSNSTEENFKFSKILLDDHFAGKSYRVVYATNDFHIYRAGQYAKRAGFDAAHIHAPLQNYAVISTYLREFAAVCALWAKGLLSM